MAKRKMLTANNQNLNENNNDGVRFDRGYDEFISNAKVRGLSPYTIRFYDNVSRIIYKFLDDKLYGYKTPISNFSTEIVNQFIIYCRELGENDVTVNTNLRGLRTILYYFMRVGYLDEFKISLNKQREPVIETYSEEELRLLLCKPNLKKCSFIEYRNYVVINFLLSTGARASTVINLRIGDIDFTNELITFRHTKNKKLQIVPLSNTLKAVLLEYIRIRSGDSDSNLFPNAYGQKATVNVLSESIRDYTRKRGVSKTGLHRYRHTFAKYYLLNGGDVFRLKALLGHSTLEVTNRYVTLFAPDLKKDYESLNPLDKLNPKLQKIKL